MIPASFLPDGPYAPNGFVHIESGAHAVNPSRRIDLRPRHRNRNDEVIGRRGLGSWLPVEIAGFKLFEKLLEFRHLRFVDRRRIRSGFFQNDLVRNVDRRLHA